MRQNFEGRKSPFLLKLEQEEKEKKRSRKRIKLFRMRE